MTKELLKQVLEALEPLSAYGRVGSRDLEQAKAQAAVSALKEHFAQPAQQEPTQYQELRGVLKDLMDWQVKNVKVWHNSAYDNAKRVLDRHEATSPPAAQHTEPVGCVADIDRLQRQMFLDLGYSLSDPLYATPPAQSAPVLPQGWSAIEVTGDHTNVWPMTEAQILALALAPVTQPEQEPVDEILDRLEVFVGGLGKAILRELRTELATPPAAQRTWVGLTHEQAKVFVAKYGNDPLNLVFQAEAMMKEKNDC
jgi:hypothetical protein